MEDVYNEEMTPIPERWGGKYRILNDLAEVIQTEGEASLFNYAHPGKRMVPKHPNLEHAHLLSEYVGTTGSDLVGKTCYVFRVMRPFSDFHERTIAEQRGEPTHVYIAVRKRDLVPEPGRYTEASLQRSES
jgi:hypothetical protein